MNNLPGYAEGDLQREGFQRQMAMMKKLMQQFETLPAKINELAKDAEHDPEARARLKQLEQAWNNGLHQDVQKMQDSAKKALDFARTYQKNLMELANGPTQTPVLPVQASVKKKKSRQFV